MESLSDTSDRGSFPKFNLNNFTFLVDTLQAPSSSVDSVYRIRRHFPEKQEEF